MEAHEWKLVDYQMECGFKPYPEWLRTIKDSTIKAKITASVRKMVHGNFGDSKSVGEGVMELRLHFGPGYRVYYSLENDELVLLLIGSKKIDQQRRIDKAKEHLADYRRRTDGKQR